MFYKDGSSHRGFFLAGVANGKGKKKEKFFFK